MLGQLEGEGSVSKDTCMVVRNAKRYGHESGCLPRYVYLASMQTVQSLQHEHSNWICAPSLSPRATHTQ